MGMKINEKLKRYKCNHAYIGNNFCSANDFNNNNNNILLEHTHLSF